MLGNDNVGKLLFKLSMPATIGMMVIALYNVVDTIFVGQGVGVLAIGGLTVIFPIHMITMALAQTIGIGGSSIISRALGAKDIDKANLTFGNLITLVIIFSIVFTPTAYYFRDELLFLFGAKGKIMQYAHDYFSIVVWGSPFLSISMVLSSVLRAEGNAKISMNLMLIAAAINLIFDPIFIFAMNMGIKGAAYASILSQVVMTSYVLWFYLSKRGTLKFSKKLLWLDPAIVKETFAIGASSFARQVSGSIVAAVLNHSIIAYGGEIAMAAFGAINRVLMLMFMPIFGIAQGFLPIAGYNYGAKNNQRVIDTIKVAIKWSSIFSLIGFLWFLFLPRLTLSIFSTDEELLSIGTNALRIIIIAFPVIGFQVIGASLFQAMGKALPSLLLSMLRQIFFVLPLIAILPMFWQIDGIWIAFPIADSLSFLVTLLFVLPQIKKLRQLCSGEIKPN